MTQLERILDVLRDRREHTAAELYRTGCVLHSRVSDLRKRGYVIELSRTDGVGAESFLYRLVSTPEEVTGFPCSVAASGAERVTAALDQPTAELGEAPDYIEGQLNVFDALGAVA